jgi:transposase-like protein
MKPFTEVTRLWRCGFAARIGHSFFFPARQLFLSVRCMNISEVSRVLDKSPELLSNEVSEAQAGTGGKMVGSLWTEDELRQLKDAYSQGLTTKAASALFPARTLQGVRKKYRDLSRDEQPHRKTAGTAYVPWSAVDIHLLQELIAEGASERKMLAHFPTRSQDSVTMATIRYRTRPCTEKSGRVVKWSTEDHQYLTKLAIQGISRGKIAEAIGRTIGAVTLKARNLGVQIQSTRSRFTSDEKERVLQMRSDGASFKDIGAAVGRHADTIRSLYHVWRPVTEYDAKQQHTPFARLSLSDLQAISSMRDNGSSWPDIGCQYPEHDLLQLRNDMKLFMKPGLSYRELREIEHLRAEGKSWQDLAITGNYPCKSQSGLRRAYHRSLKQQK